MRTLLFAASLVVSPLLCEAADAPLAVELNSVVDVRAPLRAGAAASGTGLVVSIRLPTAGAPVFIRRVTVDKAVTDDGADVRRSALQPQSIRTMAPYQPGGSRSANGLSTFIYLENFPRRAKTLRSVEGSIELFRPAIAPDAMVRIAQFLSRRGETFKTPVFSSNGIEITFLTDAMYEQRRLTFPGEAERPGYGRQIVLYVKDPEARMLAYEVQDASGKSIRFRASSGRFDDQRGMLVEIAGYPGEPPIPADTQLVFYVAVPESIVTIPFHFENVELP